MEILSARSALLSNYEVYKLLKQQQAQQLKEEQKFEVEKALLQQSSEKKGLEGDSTIGLVSRRKEEAPPENLVKIQEQAITYLGMAPHATLRQNEATLKHLMQALRRIDLSKAEKLMIVNLAPTEPVELYSIVEELEDRFPGGILEVIDLVAGSLIDAPVGSAEESADAMGYSDSAIAADIEPEDIDYWTGGGGDEPEYYDEPAYGIVDDLQDNAMDED